MTNLTTIAYHLGTTTRAVHDTVTALGIPTERTQKGWVADLTHSDIRTITNRLA